VGDIVELQIESEDDAKAMIVAITDRQNYVVRESNHNKNLRQIIASNIDQALLVATIEQPKTSLGFIDRFLISCEARHVPAIIWFNKSDLLNEDGLAYYANIKEIYETAGYKVYLSNMQDAAMLALLRTIIDQKITLISGHSGVGKSTLINCLLPDLGLRTSEVSEWSGKGLHTTTYAEMFDVPSGGKIIDTPGIRELGVIDIEKEELAGYFPELREAAKKCKYNNCVHVNEPDCAVQAAVSNGKMHVERFESYLNILATIRKKW
jgi:ribosome biogenesis GTPase / thiamine phosphate phosphatase